MSESSHDNQLNEKGLTQILVPVIIVTAIIASVYLVQQRTHILPFASETPPNPLEQTDKDESIFTRRMHAILQNYAEIAEEVFKNPKATKISITVLRKANSSGGSELLASIDRSSNLQRVQDHINSWVSEHPGWANQLEIRVNYDIDEEAGNIFREQFVKEQYHSYSGHYPPTELDFSNKTSEDYRQLAARRFVIMDSANTGKVTAEATYHLNTNHLSPIYASLVLSGINGLGLQSGRDTNTVGVQDVRIQYQSVAGYQLYPYADNDLPDASITQAEFGISFKREDSTTSDTLTGYGDDPTGLDAAIIARSRTNIITATGDYLPKIIDQVLD